MNTETGQNHQDHQDLGLDHHLVQGHAHILQNSHDLDHIQDPLHAQGLDHIQDQSQGQILPGQGHHPLLKMKIQTRKRIQDLGHCQGLHPDLVLDQDQH